MSNHDEGWIDVDEGWEDVPQGAQFNPMGKLFGSLKGEGSGKPLTAEEQKEISDYLMRATAAGATGLMDPLTLGWSEKLDPENKLGKEFPKIKAAGQVGGNLLSMYGIGGPMSKVTEKSGQALSKLFSKYPRIADMIGSGTANLAMGTGIVGASNLPEGVDRVEAMKQTATDPLTMGLSYAPEALRQFFGGRKGAEVAARKFTRPSDELLSEEARVAGRSAPYDKKVGDPVGRELIDQGVFGNFSSRGRVQENIASARNEAGKEIGNVVSTVKAKGGGDVHPQALNNFIEDNLNLRKSETDYTGKRKFFDKLKKDLIKVNKVEVEVPTTKVIEKEVPVDPTIFGRKKDVVKQVVPDVKKETVTTPLDIEKLYKEKVLISKELPHGPLQTQDARNLARFDRAKMRGIMDLTESKVGQIHSPEELKRFQALKKTFGALEDSDEAIRSSRKNNSFRKILDKVGEHPGIALGTASTIAGAIGGRYSDAEQSTAIGAGAGALTAGGLFGPSMWVNYLNNPQTRFLMPLLQRQRIKTMKDNSAWEDIPNE